MSFMIIVITVHVAAPGEGRFHDLAKLLQDWGSVDDGTTRRKRARETP